MKKLIFFFIFLYSSSLLSYDYKIDIHGKIVSSEKHKYSDDSYYSILKLDGTFTDNFSNYGNFNALVSLEIDNGELKQHFFSAELTYQDGSIFYGQGSRTSREFEQGTGKLLITTANKKLQKLIGVKCVYAINFFGSTSFTLTKCNISDSQKNVLSNISDNK
ncbi:MAG: hypothetical protein CMP24_06855 [Rickettsiales bacterium]|nr:hypothetical protein [Rickettsiales bacterium]